MANRYELAHMVWQHLIDAAEQRRTLTYQELASRVGYTVTIAMRWALDPIYHLCDEKEWPHIDGIVVNKKTGRPGSGFSAWRAEDIQRMRQEVYSFSWSEVDKPFSPDSRAPLAHRAARLRDFSVPDQFVRVNGRGAYQQALRKEVLKSYGHCCALCDTRHAGLLVASHVIPWAQDPANRCNPRNAILLCRAHDALFELDILRIRADGSVTINPPAGKELGEAVETLLNHGTAGELRVSLPSGAPDPTLLSRRLRDGT